MGPLVFVESCKQNQHRRDCASSYQQLQQRLGCPTPRAPGGGPAAAPGGPSALQRPHATWLAVASCLCLWGVFLPSLSPSASPSAPCRVTGGGPRCPCSEPTLRPTPNPAGSPCFCPPGAGKPFSRDSAGGGGMEEPLLRQSDSLGQACLSSPHQPNLCRQASWCGPSRAVTGDQGLLRVGMSLEERKAH